MAIMKDSDYFVPSTQCNAAGVPQVRSPESTWRFCAGSNSA